MNEIFQAVINLDFKIVNELINGGLDANICDSEDTPLIHFAIEGYKLNPNPEYFDMLTLLLNKGADINAQDYDGWTMLNSITSKCDGSESSTHEDNFKMVEYLLKMGANPNIQDNKGFSALHCSIISKDEKLVNLLIAIGANPNMTSKKGRTALFFAVDTEMANIAEFLLKNGADPNIGDENGITPIYIAASKYDLKLVKLLLETSANPNGNYKSEEKESTKSNIYNNEKNMKTMGTPLHFAAAFGDIAFARLLLDYGAEINFPDNYNWSPLHIAAGEGNTEMVNFLLDRGANIEFKGGNSGTETPLLYTFNPEVYNNEHLEVVKLLLKRGVNVNARSMSGTPGIEWNAFNYAARYIKDQKLRDLTIKYLLANGVEVINASVNYSQQEIDDMLINYAKEGDSLGVRAQLNLGANINAQSDDGWSALLEAVVNDISLVEFLLEKGADPNIASELGYTPLMRAAGIGNIDVVKLLIKYKADLTKVDNYGQTAYIIALKQGFTSIASILVKE